MDFPDLLAIIGGALSLIGALLGLSTDPRPGQEWLDNGQRGAFLGAVVGAVAAFAVGGALLAMGENPW